MTRANPWPTRASRPSRRTRRTSCLLLGGSPSPRPGGVIKTGTTLPRVSTPGRKRTYGNQSPEEEEGRATARLRPAEGQAQRGDPRDPRDRTGHHAWKPEGGGSPHPRGRVRLDQSERADQPHRSGGGSADAHGG